MAGKTNFSKEATTILQAAEKSGIRTPVLRWLSKPANVDRLPTKAEPLGWILDLVSAAGKYRISESVFGWLHDFRNTEQAAKDWHGFWWVVTSVGKYKLAKIVFGWLSNPRNAQKVSGNWHGFARLLDGAGKYKLVEASLDWLSKADCSTKGLSSIASVISCAGEHKIAEPVFNWLLQPWNFKEKQNKDLEGLVRTCGQFGIAKTVFCWLSYKKNMETVEGRLECFVKFVDACGRRRCAEIAFHWLSEERNLRNVSGYWDGLAEAIDNSAKNSIPFTLLFAYLSDETNMVRVRFWGWSSFAQELNKKDTQLALKRYEYLLSVCAWFEKKGLPLLEEEKWKLMPIVHSMQQRKRNACEAVNQLLQYLPAIRKACATIENKQARSFVLKYAMLYIAISDRPPSEFKKFVDSLESSKKRASDMRKVGLDPAYWDRYVLEKNVPIAGRAQKPITIPEILSATAKFQQCLNTQTQKLRRVSEGREGILPKLNEAILIQEYAKKQGLPELSDDTRKEYLEIVYRYYAEHENWKQLPEEMTKNYDGIAKKINELLERFGYAGAIIKLCVTTWSRKIPEDISIANVCGDCTCTTSNYPDMAANATTRLVDNGYSILKILFKEGKSTHHIGNIYCMAYIADGDSCLAIDGIEVTQSFGYGSPEVAKTLVDFTEGYALACRFKSAIINHYPSNSAWIREYVGAHYKQKSVNLRKMGGNAHLKELGLEGEKVIREGNTEVFRIM